MAKDRQLRDLVVGDVVTIHAVVTKVNNACVQVELLREDEETPAKYRVVQDEDSKLLEATLLPLTVPELGGYRIPVILPASQLEIYKPHNMPSLKTFEDTAVISGREPTPPDPRR